MPQTPSSLYPPTIPPKSNGLVRVPGSSLTSTDKFLVAASSLTIVGAVAWVPLFYAWAYKKWKAIPKHFTKKRALYGALLMSIAGLAITGPHRSKRFGEYLGVRKWKLWKSWLRFIAFEVVQSVGGNDPTNQMMSEENSNSGSNSSYINENVVSASSETFDMKNDQAILAVIPHGIFPFALAFATFTEEGERAFGKFRPVVATATKLVPILNTLISWLHPVDASKSNVDLALSQGARIGMSPGGIAEMFEGFPKPMTHPDDECAILNSRKGFIRMAVKHNVPVVPIYCFGSTKMFKRLQFSFLEYLSKMLRVSICLFFGRCGLPIPFRQRLLYVMGEPIFPPAITEGNSTSESSEEFSRRVNEMHKLFCDELVRLFDQYKDSYGWGRKTMRLL
uniref:Acyltransferase n=2 Tax=Ditylum brightwellii TaxID=49249 RepID=A0A6V2C002_9STRA|mmetsp:Transcript_22232/g.29605  ORF Transcript_22232/g.29605 Transcript_22232/m.29605 type:complete len:393 (+) Transcript_22232:132-1310(+)